MTYVDGFLLSVPTEKKDEYQAFAKKCWSVFKKYGALSMVECWGDDVPEGKLNSFHTAVMREPGETVVFSWTTWESKAARDAGWEKVMADPEMAQMGPDQAPFDGKRMIYGGFEPIVEVKA